MTGPHNPIAPSGQAAHSGGSALRYSFLFVMQTLGTAILLWYGIPLYRQVIEDPGGHEPRPGRLIWSLSAIALMQSGYWIRHRLRLPPPQLRNTLVGHIILFAARMAFVVAASIFGFVFIARNPELQVPASRYVVLIIGLFALFCYTQELEQLGRALIAPNQKPGGSP